MGLGFWGVGFRGVGFSGFRCLGLGVWGFGGLEGQLGVEDGKSVAALGSRNIMQFLGV